jgi:AcrR family transcriptional regulator
MQRKPREEARKVRTDLYRQHIFAAAERVFAERGFDAAKVQEISEIAGLSMGTIYAIFPSKDDVFRAILEARGEEVLQLVRDVVARHAPPRDALRDLANAYIGYFFAHPDFLRMHLRHGSSWVLGPTPSEDSRVQLWREIHALQSEVFTRGVQAGAFIDEDPAYLAKLFSAMDQVLLADWVASGMKADRATLLARLDRLVDRTFCVATAPAAKVSRTRAARK